MADDGTSQDDVERAAREVTQQAPDGAGLTEQAIVLVEIATRSSVTVMDAAGTRAAMARALQLGVTPEQIQEVLTLVSGLGTHTLFLATVGLTALVDGESPRGRTADEQALWDEHVGDSSYWRAMEEEVPGFLDALCKRSPETFRAFFDYCAVPWASRHVEPMTKELIAAAVDATPLHRYLPGMRLHLRNAVKLGATKQQVQDALRVAAEAPARPML